jgi:hypothetical protein
MARIAAPLLDFRKRNTVFSVASVAIDRHRRTVTAARDSAGPISNMTNGIDQPRKNTTGNRFVRRAATAQ